MGNGHGKAKKSRGDPLALYNDEIPWKQYRGSGVWRTDSASALDNQEENAIGQQLCMKRKPIDILQGLDSDLASDKHEGGPRGLDSDSGSDNEEDILQGLDSDLASDKHEDYWRKREHGSSKYLTRRKARRASTQHDSGSLAKKMDTVLVMENKEESPNVSEEYAIAQCYSMKRHPRGYAIIINNVNFDGGNVRKGSDIDAGRLAHVFSKAQFTIILKRDVTSEEIFNTLRKYSAEDHSNFDAFVCCILSHGSEDRVNGIDGESIKIHDLVTLYKGNHCRSLAGKPKLFFIQACQGHEDHFVVGIERDNLNTGRRYVPSEADMLIAQSTVPGYFSYRDTEKGSWYIQSFVKHFDENYKKTHLMDILTLVSDDVSKNKQMPTVSSTLRKNLYF